MKVVCIVDFDNVFPHKLQSYTQDDLNRVFRQVIDILLSHKKISAIKFRLYGGWFMGDDMTNRCSLLMQMINHIQQWFPMLMDGNRIINGDIEVALELKSVPYQWKNTYKEHRGIPKLRIDSSKCGDLCESNKPQCPIKIMQSYTKARDKECHIEGCLVKHGEVFYRREQKMVDTMMACDIISYSIEEPQTALAVISDDVDLFPALALRGNLIKEEEKSLTVLFIKNPMNKDSYGNIIGNFNVIIEQYHE